MSATAVYFLSFIALGLASASLGPTLPGLAEQTGVQIGQAGILFTTRSLGYLVGSAFGGRLYDRMRGNPLMGFALLLMAGVLAVVPAVPLLWVLALVLLAIGLGEGLLDVGGNTLIVWTHGRKVGPYMNGLHFFFGVGSFLAPLVVAQVILWSGGIGWTYRLIALVILPVGLWLFWLGGPDRPNATDGGGADAAVNNRLVVLIVVFFILYVGAEVSFGGWIFTYAVRMGLLGEAAAAYLTSGFWIAFTLARLLSIPLAARVRPQTILMFSLAGALVSLAAVLARPGSLTVLWAGSVGFGFSIAAIFPTMLTFAGRRMAVTGRVTGYFFLGATIGSMTVPWLVGRAIGGSGPGAMIGIELIVVGLAAAVLAVLGVTTRGRVRTLQPGKAGP